MTHAIGIERAREAIRYLSHPETPWSAEQVEAVIAAYLSALKPSGDAGEATAWRIAGGMLTNIREVAERYRSDGVEVVPLVPAPFITTLVAENERQGEQIQRMEYSDGDAEHWRFLATGLERQLATAREAALEEAATFFTTEAARMYEEAMTHPIGMKRRAAENAAGYHTSVAEILRALIPGVSDAE